MKKLSEIELIGADGAKLILQTKNIYRVGKNAITVKNNQAVEFKTKESNLILVPTASKVYSITGEFLGVVEEVLFDEKFKTQKISLNNNDLLDVKDIASIGKNAVVFYNNNEKVNVAKFTPRKQPKVFKQKEIQIAKTLPTQDETVNKEKRLAVVQNSDFLLGRVCTKDIFNFNNELLIKAHAVVNKKHLKEINKFGKLKELMLYVR